MLFQDGTGRCAAVSFRPCRLEDSASFRRCIEDFYDGGYPYKEYLDGAFLMEKCRAGQMIVLCGVTPEGEVVSTSAVRFDTEFPGSGLLLLRVVKEAYRGMGIGSAQEKELFKRIRAREGLRSLYADVMTHNAVSQGSLARRGFVLCGLRLMLYKPDIMVPRLPLPKESKLSQAVMCRAGSMQDAGMLYCPAEHGAAAQRIYSALGVRCELNPNLTLPKKPNTIDSWQEETEHHIRIWMVRSAGKDISKAADNALKRVQPWNDATILCYLNIKDAAAVYAYEKLRRKGFFFTGFKPLQMEEEYMLLTYIGDRQICEKDICLCADGGWLLTYIQEHRANGKGGMLGENDQE